VGVCGSPAEGATRQSRAGASRTWTAYWRIRGLLPWPTLPALPVPGTPRNRGARRTSSSGALPRLSLEGGGYREELERQARYDWLTGLGNRRAFERRLEEGLSPGWGLALLDLDNLKQVNDSQGHLAGDRLIIGLAHALRAVGLEAYRLAGDEFAVFLQQKDVFQLHQALQSMAVSLGVAWAEEAQGKALLALADSRMYAQKSAKKSLR